MREFEIYLPLTKNDGSLVDREKLGALRQVLLLSFGGYTELRHRGEGAWRIGGVTYFDEVAILKVIAANNSDFDLRAFKRRAEADLKQESILIVERDVRVV